MVHNRMAEKRPPLSRTFHFRRAFYFLFVFFFLGGSVVVFQAARTSLPTQRGFRCECGKRLCGSPKINNEPSYTTRLSSLDVNGKSGGRRSIGMKAAAAAVAVGGRRRVGERGSGGVLIVASRASPIMHSWSFSRVSAGSTGIE